MDKMSQIDWVDHSRKASILGLDKSASIKELDNANRKLSIKLQQ